MGSVTPNTVFYKRCQFTTRLPASYLYSPFHYWIAEQEPGLWRVGMTKFATRVLGEIVDFGFQVQPGQIVSPGEMIGWIEGFKAVSDIFCIAEGAIVRTNDALQTDITLIGNQPYDSGWMYEARGKPAAECTNVQGYVAILDETIDCLRAKREKE